MEPILSRFPTPLYDRLRSRNRLEGTLPPELPQVWPNMTDLELDLNRLTGPLPEAWARFKFIQTLTLR
jgi:hypothetical protein